MALLIVLIAAGVVDFPAMLLLLVLFAAATGATSAGSTATAGRIPSIVLIACLFQSTSTSI